MRDKLIGSRWVLVKRVRVVLERELCIDMRKTEFGVCRKELVCMSVMSVNRLSILDSSIVLNLLVEHSLETIICRRHRTYIARAVL